MVKNDVTLDERGFENLLRMCGKVDDLEKASKVSFFFNAIQTNQRLMHVRL
jgi:hypothetical protein